MHRLTCFLRGVYISPRRLHRQEVEEHPQGAGEAPEMRLAALAADPVHLLGNHSALRDRGERGAHSEERRGGRREEKLPGDPKVRTRTSKVPVPGYHFEVAFPSLWPHPPREHRKGDL